MILLPLYTRVLTQEEYGILAVSRLVGTFTSTFLALGLHAGAARLYFEYRDNPKELKEFWGTIFCTMAILSGTLGLGLALWGEPLLGPFTEGVPFRPYITLAVVTAAFTPFVTTYLRILQTMQQSATFFFLSLARFLSNVLLVIYLVVGLKMGAAGPLTGYCIVAGAFLVVSILSIRKHLTPCIRWRYLKSALGFSLPVLPSSIASQVANVADRLIINKQFGSERVGLYHTGYQIGSLVGISVDATSAAFTPIFNDAMKSGNPKKLGEIKRIGLYLVYGFCNLGLLLSLFAQEVVAAATGAGFHSAYIVVPCITFQFVGRGIYVPFVTALQYRRETIWLSVLINFIGTGLNVGLNLWWIPLYGIQGAAVAGVTAQAIATLLTAIIGHAHTKIPWQYARYAGLAACSAVPSLGICFFAFDIGWGTFGIKVFLLLVTHLLMNLVAWGNVLYPYRKGRFEIMEILRIRGWFGQGE
jgi:O-antigen/teichoic acid export membrane protein